MRLDVIKKFKKPKMNQYQLYGFSIASEFDIPELQQTDSRSDILIRLGNVELPRSLHNDNNAVAAVEDAVAYLSYSDIGAFEIRDGSEIVVDTESGDITQPVRAILMGPAFGFLLQQRNLLVLHASSVKRNGRAYVFLGEKGAGKSTIASGFVDQGDTVLSDDVTVLNVSDEDYHVLPGRPHLKLEQNHSDYEPFPTTADLEMKKQYYRIPNQEPEIVDNIAGLFILKRGSKLTINPITGGEAVWKILNHLYLWQFTDELETESNFQQVSRLVKQTDVLQLERTDELDSLPELLKMVEDAV